MGSDQFIIASKGKTAQEAFVNAIQDAQYKNGHNGYTGTIAEKSSFIEFPFPNDKPLRKYIDELMANEIEDKWGPAGCIAFKPGHPDEFIFFGWASC
jgi:hypothetical protein